MWSQGIFAIMRTGQKTIVSKFLLRVGGIVLLAWGSSHACCAEQVINTRDFSLVHYEQASMLPAWETDHAIYEALNSPVLSLRINRLSRQTNLELNNALSRFSKKVRLSFSPKVVMKPFIAVREVQDVLAFYQSRQLTKQVEIDQNFEAKIAKLMLAHRASINNLSRSKLFALSPYQNRIYGLHLQINFK